MILAPWAWNVAPAATLLTPAAACEPAFPVENLWTTDPLQVARFRGGFTVTASLYDQIKSGGWTATIDPGFYASPGHLAVNAIAKINAAAGISDAFVRMVRDSANRHRWQLGRTGGGTFSLTIAGEARSLLRGLLGFRNADRSAAATHTGDFAAVHGPYDAVRLDLGTSPPIVTLAAVINPRLSPAGALQVAYGDTTSFEGGARGGTVDLGEAADDELVAQAFTTPTNTTGGRRYWEARFADPCRLHSPRVAIGGLYLGPRLDLDDPNSYDHLTWETPGLVRAHDIRWQGKASVVGPLHLGEVQPGELVSLPFQSAPGLPSSVRDGLAQVIQAVGVNGYILIMADPTREPNRETRLCRLTAPPQWGPVNHDGLGVRYAWTPTFEVVSIR